MTTKLKILLDVDGVLANFTRAFLDYFGNGATDADITQWDIVKALADGPHALPVDAYRQFGEDVGRLNLCSTIQPYPGSRDFVDTLRALGHEVVACTSPMNAAWLSQRAAWLERHFDIKVKHQIHCSDKSRIEGDVLIDDNWEHCHDFVRGRGQQRFALLFDRPWNQPPVASRQMRRVANYAHILELVGEQ